MDVASSRVVRLGDMRSSEFGAPQTRCVDKLHPRNVCTRREARWNGIRWDALQSARAVVRVCARVRRRKKRERARVCVCESVCVCVCARARVCVWRAGAQAAIEG